jgi:hypothetical protein
MEQSSTAGARDVRVPYEGPAVSVPHYRQDEGVRISQILKPASRKAGRSIRRHVHLIKRHEASNSVCIVSRAAVAEGVAPLCAPDLRPIPRVHGTHQSSLRPSQVNQHRHKRPRRSKPGWLTQLVEIQEVTAGQWLWLEEERVTDDAAETTPHNTP